MPDPGSDAQIRIETVRGRLDPEIESEIRTFWSEQNVLPGPEADQRLREVVCVFRDSGRVSGVSSAFAAQLELIGGRRFWIYRNLLAPGVADRKPDMIRATFEALDAEFSGAPGEPLGLCVLVGDPEERRQRPEAEWSNPRMTYAGYLPGGRQVRIGYFEGAEIA